MPYKIPEQEIISEIETLLNNLKESVNKLHLVPVLSKSSIPPINCFISVIEEKLETLKSLTEDIPVLMFIDDIRNPENVFPLAFADRFDYVCRSSKDAIRIIKRHKQIPNFISFDHDLGGDDIAMKVVDFIIENVLSKKYKLPDNFEFNVHSANPIGKMNIETKLNNFYEIRNRINS